MHIRCSTRPIHNSQVESPLYHDSWLTLADQDNLLEQRRKNDSTGFWKTSRTLSPASKQQYPHCIVMEHKDLGLVIVPDIALYAMQQISFWEAVRSALKMNTEIFSLHLYMRRLCTAIICSIFDLEDPASQKCELQEVCAFHLTVDTGQLADWMMFADGCLGQGSRRSIGELARHT